MGGRRVNSGGLTLGVDQGEYQMGLGWTGLRMGLGRIGGLDLYWFWVIAKRVIWFIHFTRTISVIIRNGGTKSANYSNIIPRVIFAIFQLSKDP